MNFKYLWPNLQGIDQALPSKHPDFLTAELSCCISYTVMVHCLSDNPFKIASLLPFSVAFLSFDYYYTLYYILVLELDMELHCLHILVIVSVVLFVEISTL